MKAVFQPPSRTSWPHLIGAWLVVLLPLLVLGAISEDVWEQQSFRFDAPILLWLHRHASPFLDAAMLWLSRVGGGALLGVSVLWGAALFARKRRKDALFVLGCVGGAGLLNLAAKLVFGRTRPDLWISLTPQADYSFPSGHAMLSSAFMGAALVLTLRSELPLLFKRLLVGLEMLFVLAVGLSRLYLGVHFPTDILAGWLASAAWVALLRVFLANT